MPTPVAQWIVAALTLYIAIGTLFSLIFATRGVQSIDANARGTSILFRILIIPGTAALWPLLLHRWVRRDPPAPIPHPTHPEDQAG